MYSGWSPFLRTKFWKKEFVGSGVERRSGEKKREGSETTVDWALGKRNGALDRFWNDDDNDILGGSGSTTSSGAEGDGTSTGVEGDGGENSGLLRRFLRVLVTKVFTLLLSFFSIIVRLLCKFFLK